MDNYKKMSETQIKQIVEAYLQNVADFFQHLHTLLHFSHACPCGNLFQSVNKYFSVIMCTAQFLGGKRENIQCSTLQQESFSFLKELLINHIEYAIFLWKSKLLLFFLGFPLSFRLFRSVIRTVFITIVAGNFETKKVQLLSVVDVATLRIRFDSI